MKHILFVAVGVWIGREIYTRLAVNRSKEREQKIQAKLERFLKEQLPLLSSSDTAKHIKQILN